MNVNQRELFYDQSMLKCIIYTSILWTLLRFTSFVFALLNHFSINCIKIWFPNLSGLVQMVLFLELLGIKPCTKKSIPQGLYMHFRKKHLYIIRFLPIGGAGSVRSSGKEMRSYGALAFEIFTTLRNR
jgi:hypothetical protein